MNNPDGLQTIDEQTLSVPDTRMKDAASTQALVRQLYYADQMRNYKRSRLNGLVDGNPPYKSSYLKAAGRADAANFNAGGARAFLESAKGAIYDLFHEASGSINIRTSYGSDPNMREDWSNVMSEEAHTAVTTADSWDATAQLSIRNMILHGTGPLFFEDGFRVIPKSQRSGDLLVPEGTPSDITKWDACSIASDYYPPQLYEFIRDEKAATTVGWNVEYTKKVIATALGWQQGRDVPYDWTLYQRMMKDNSYFYYQDNTKQCRLAYVFWKEFDGRVTQALVQRDSAAGLEVQYLMIHVGKYANFAEAVHPMYYDVGDGDHYSVDGLGVKMYSLMEYQNRLLCNLCDKAFSPKVLFKPTTTEAGQKFEMKRLGDFGVIPYGFDWNLTGVPGLMQDGLAMNGEIQNTLYTNLSSYRKPMEPQKSGNPVTALQVQVDTAEQSALSNTQYNRYYVQLDQLYAEMSRRLNNLNTPDPIAKDYQKRCIARGVPRECFGRIESVTAARVTGQGSAFMRKQSLQNLWVTIGPSLPEDGRDHLIQDQIAAQAGQTAVNRYYPRPAKPMATDQQADATQWVGDMKVGIPPVITSTQNPVVYAATWLQAASQAVGSLQQGANPPEVLQFLEIIGPAIGAQLQRFAQDPSRQSTYKVLEQKWKQLIDATNQLVQHVQDAQKQAQEQQVQTQQAMSDEQLKQAQTEADIKLKSVKTAAQLKQSQEKHALKMQQGVQSLALKDATVASQIHLDNEKAKAQKNAPKKSS